MEVVKRLWGGNQVLQHSNSQTGGPDSPKRTVMSDPAWCPRLSTARELSRMVIQERVILVRGTPTSGKTVLARLLHKYNLENDINSVYIIGWPQKAHHTTYLVEQAAKYGYKYLDADSIRDFNGMFIIDEAQITYSDRLFWLDMIKAQGDRQNGATFCLFATYGSASQGPEEYENVAGSPLASLSVRQRVSIVPSMLRGSPRISLFYTRDEFYDVLERRKTDPSHPVTVTDDAADYICSLTQGQPGAVTGVLGMLYWRFQSDFKHARTDAIGKDDIISLLDDQEESFHYLKQQSVNRSFINRKILTTEAANVLREVLVKGSIERDLNNPGIRSCYLNGWLHAEPLDEDALDVVCVFPTRLHAKYVEHYLMPKPAPFPFHKYPTITALAEAALKRYSPRNIVAATRIGTGAIRRSVEACYADEFYRCLHDVLGFSTNVSSEWSGSSDGRIDFRIGDVGWGIEFLRDGDRLANHCSRFVADGSYTKWIQSGLLKDWLVIDCRTSRPQKYHDSTAKLWRVVFDIDFSSACILGPSNEEIVPKFVLMSS